MVKYSMVEITEIADAFVQLLSTLPLHPRRRTIAHSTRLDKLYTTRVLVFRLSNVENDGCGLQNVMI